MQDLKIYLGMISLEFGREKGLAAQKCPFQFLPRRAPVKKLLHKAKGSEK